LSRYHFEGELLMSEKEPVADDDARRGVAEEIDEFKGTMKAIGGSRSDHWNNILGNQALKTLWSDHSDEKTRNRQKNATVAALAAIAPRDELEAMIAAQLLGAHNAAMECYRRAIKEQTLEGNREALNQANRLSRTYAVLLDALNRHRGKGQQKVTVEHVHVHSGGQAIVGMVEGVARSSDSENAKQIVHAPQPAVRSADQEPETVPSTRHAERAMSDARRTVPGSTEGK
jgi:hypothetical protein